jgi:hypothetical protein
MQYAVLETVCIQEDGSCLFALDASMAYPAHKKVETKKINE